MSDTITAISTPAGEGGIGIVRTSGPASLSVMRSLMKNCPEEPADRHAYYGKAVNPSDGTTIDECIFIFMKAPHTYTCEDVLEIQAHGSIISLKKILRAAIAAGARPAEPGEFTKLAFLNGRIDLAQAEAVIDIITAKTELPEAMAVRQLEGRLSQEVVEMRNSLVDVLAEMAVNIDFPDEDIEQFEFDRFISDISSTAEKLRNLVATADSGRIVRDGLRVAIVGKPNVGKSSLMNALLGESRVIVTDVPGTTRDTVEEAISIGGIPIVLVDTAGMRESQDTVESIGIERSWAEMNSAELVLFVLDSSRRIEEEDLSIAEALKEMFSKPGSSLTRLLLVLNKTDLPQLLTRAEAERLFTGDFDESIGGTGGEFNVIPEKFKSSVIETNLTAMSGADAVKEEIGKMIADGMLRSESGNTVMNERHRAAMERALEALASAEELLIRSEAIEIVEIEVHRAFEALGEIIGESTGEEILDAVFSRFCLGK